MSAKWREFHSWRCDACSTENILLERKDDHVDKAAIFPRACASCGAQAAGRTIRPAQIVYRIVARQEWRPERSLRHTP